MLGDEPGRGDLAGRVAGVQRGVQAVALPVGEPVGAAAQQPAGAEQRVVGVAAVPEGVLLYPAADDIDAGQTEFDDMKWVQYADGLRQLRCQGGGVSEAPLSSSGASGGWGMRRGPGRPTCAG